MEGSATEFSEAARLLGMAARGLGLKAPSFRTPPRLSGTRSIRRWPDGTVLVSVALRGRPFRDVLVDMIEGVVAANRVPRRALATVRRQLWDAVVPLVSQAA